MLRFAADENFNNNLLRRLQRDVPGIDIVRIQDTPIAGAKDETVLDWVASENRILLTHDISTVPDYAYERINKGLPMPGVLVIPADAPYTVADDLILIVECSFDNEWDNRVQYLPLK